MGTVRYLRAERKAARRRGARSARGRADARARARRARARARRFAPLTPLVRLPEQVIRGVVVVAAETARHAPRLVERARRASSERISYALWSVRISARARAREGRRRAYPGWTSRERVVRLADLRRARRRVDLEQREVSERGASSASASDATESNLCRRAHRYVATARILRTRLKLSRGLLARGSSGFWADAAGRGDAARRGGAAAVRARRAAGTERAATRARAT